jgi:hypothetical protein
MPEPEHDPLLALVRAADPTAGTATQSGVDRERVATLRRVRFVRRRRQRTIGAGALVALLATLALASVPADRGPSDSSILLGVVGASQLPKSSIVVVRSVVTLRTNIGHFVSHDTTWLRVSADRRVLASRHYTVRKDPSRTVDSAAYMRAGTPVLETYAHRTGTFSRHVGVEATFSPAFVLSTRRYLAAARSSRRRVVIDRVRIAGHDAYRLRLPAAGGPRLRTTRELFVDATSYKPLEMRKSEVGPDIHGNPYSYYLSERVVNQRTLADTPENRRLLRVQRPTR